MHHMKGLLTRMSIPLTFALLLTMGGFSVSFAFTAPKAVTNVWQCPTLRIGARGAFPGGIVSILQNKLKGAGEQLGVAGPNHDGIDGAFGFTTQIAVMSYQRKHGLGADDVVGSLTWEKLGGCASEQAPPTPMPSFPHIPNIPTPAP